MNMRNLIPWSRGGSSPVPYGGGQDPFMSLQREMNRLFDDAFRSFGTPSLFRETGWPKIEVAETDRELRVSAELPGMEEKDVEVTFTNGTLSIRGEKRSETKDEERQFSEFYHGTFERRIPVDPEVDPDKVKASFKNGLLTVTVPKSEKAQKQAKRIQISGG